MFVCPECGAPSQFPGHCQADGTAVAAIEDDILLGTTIGAYRIARLLGIGGMGRVYKGVHPSIGSRVAIKVLSRECTDRKDLVERFFAEAKAVNLIRHESIVNVLDLATLPDGRPFIIMEYLDGAPLAAIIEHAVTAQTPLPLGGLARLAVEVLDALGAAHAKNIVHRDLKPDNIFVTPSGRPKVLDFGIAKLNDLSTGSATRTGSLLGTPHYMSPEQAAGKPVDHRADIYAIGVILFECATGQKPFSADSLFDLLRKHIEAPPPPPRAWCPDMSADLEAVILTALAKTPDQRFASAQAMSVALQHATAQLAPEQWIPITGSGSHRGIASGAWQHTPKQWSASGSTGAPRGPRESVQPPNQVHIGQQSTVSASAGQLQKAEETRPLAKPASSSKKPLWIVLGAVVLACAGAAVFLATSGGDEKPTTTVAIEQPLPPPPPPSIDAAIAEPAKVDETKADVDEARIDKPVAERIAKKTEKLDKKLDELEKQMQRVELDLAGGAPPPPPPPRGAPLWAGNYDLPGYKFTAKRVDVSAFIKFAIAEAKKADPDAVLIRIDVDNVAPDGTVDLTLPTMASDHGSIDLRFVNMERGKPDPSLPRGVPHKEKHSCEFRIELEPSGADIRTISPAITEASSCIKQQPVKPPRCTAAQIWAKAIEKGAPSGNVVAEFSYRGGMWWFDVDKTFDARYPDNC